MVWSVHKFYDILSCFKIEVTDATIFKRQCNDRAQITSDVIPKPQKQKTKKQW